MEFIYSFVRLIGWLVGWLSVIVCGKYLLWYGTMQTCYNMINHIITYHNMTWHDMT